MSDELDESAQTAAEHIAAAAAAPSGGVKTRPSRPAVLEPELPSGYCANCGTRLRGPACHVCGQVDDAYHRPFLSLLSDALDGLFSLDGRAARTIPALVFRPGRVSLQYLKGARARFIPPMRLYIVASLLFFLLVGPGGIEVSSFQSDVPRTEALAALEEARENGEIGPGEYERVRALLASAEENGDPEDGQEPSWADELRRTLVPEEFGEPAPEASLPVEARRFLANSAVRAIENPQAWAETVMNWIPRAMFLLVPVYAGLLALVYAWRRGYFFYDHLIVSLHFHAALFLVMSALIAVRPLIGAAVANIIILIYSNVHLYRIHRVVYGRGRFGAVMRTLVLDAVYLVVLLTALVAVMVLGLTAL